MHEKGQVTILGINGHIGHHTAKAFAAAGWDVVGFGRSFREPIAGVHFVNGDAENPDDLRRAVEASQVVVHALNLPYHQWDKGRMEAQTRRVVEAVSSGGKTLLFPGNIYNYAAADRIITPETPKHPETPRGAIRLRTEGLLREAAERGDVQVLILRAGDFYGPNSRGDWFEQGMLREAAKGRVSIPGPKHIGHAWAFLPDLARAFGVLASRRSELRPFESFHFSGHFRTNGDMLKAIQAAAPVPLREVAFPWAMFSLVGFAMPLVRELVKMRYLWSNSMQLRDPRLDALLGPGFGTPFKDAVAQTVAPYFTPARAAA